MPSFAETERGYAALWAKAKLTGNTARVVARILANRKRYEEVERATGVPWAWIACLHDREASGLFTGVLHNGERIIGTGKKTRLVPAGRGPFKTWAESAIDALKLKGLHKVTDWSIARMLYEAERFNGWGYTYKGVNSPYVWAGTNLQQSGKYVADHVWDPKAWDTQLGVAAVMMALEKEDPRIWKPITKVQAPVVIGATVGGSATIATATLADMSPVMLGALVALVVFLALEWAKTEKGREMLGKILANWKTSSAGSSAMLLAIADILRQVATGQWDFALLYADAMAIAIGLGLVAAKDGDVTGGSKQNK